MVYFGLQFFELVLAEYFHLGEGEQQQASLVEIVDVDADVLFGDLDFFCVLTDVVEEVGYFLEEGLVEWLQICDLEGGPEVDIFLCEFAVNLEILR